MVTRDVLKVFQIELAYGSCNFENFQNITRAHKSRNALAFMRFPILTKDFAKILCYRGKCFRECFIGPQNMWLLLVMSGNNAENEADNWRGVFKTIAL